ncbi:MAG TPA: IclR family transcriptional regulator [Nocardioidaceae bacterium]|nr:IclR family transcriptional regulator [Nocardioidaceae bacterium]
MGQVGVLDKVMAILHAFPDGAGRLQPPEIATRLGISQPTAYRLMKGMAEHGLLDYDTGGYRLGVELLHLGARVTDGLSLYHVARPHLEWLRDTTSENAELHLLHGHTRVPIEVMASPRNLRPMGQVGVPFPIHVGASSKVLLAWLPAPDRRSLANESHRADPSPASFDPQAWEEELTHTRECGWAESDGEREDGVSSIAAPVRDHSGSVVAAMVLSGPTTRFVDPKVRSSARQATLEAAARASAAIGHSPASRRADAV